MERAAAKCFEWIFEHAPNLFPMHLSGEGEWRFQVVCGTGNNGGDGMAIARMLMRNGYNVEPIVVHLGGKPSPDFTTNLGKLGASAKKQLREVSSKNELPVFERDALIIDALFGSGLNRPAEGIAADTIDAINASGATVVSIDLPSGLPSDGGIPHADVNAVCAHHILTFQFPKLAFFLAEYAPFVGETHILDIGLHPDYLNGVDVDYHLLTTPEARLLRKPRNRFSHKGDFGQALLLGGSLGMYGAVALSAEACLRAGAGKLKVHCPAGAMHGIALRLPEAMFSHESCETHLTELPNLQQFNSVGIGPGLGTHEQTARTLKLLIQECKVPLVMDADALNILAENRTWLAFLPKGSILTPHPGEWARLTGEKMSHMKGMEMQRAWSVKYGIYILLKGAHSSLSTPQGKVWFNQTGNPGMATAGSGDVLTGVITGLLAQGYSSFEAAALGMYVHGLAGDIAMQQSSEEAILASDITKELGKAFQSLNHVE